MTAQQRLQQIEQRVEGHTKGPWEVVRTFPYEDVARIFTGRQYLAAVGDTDRKAPIMSNAQLIASAPDLLDLTRELAEENKRLREALRHIERTGTVSSKRIAREALKEDR